MKLDVDKAACAGHGICVILAPDVFAFDEDDRAVVTAHPVPPGLEADAADALAECPAQAILRTGD